MERYRHSWNVLGLYLKQQPHFIRLETLGYTAQHDKLEDDIRRFLPECKQEDVLVFPLHDVERQVFWLHSGRIVRRNGDSLDFYQMTKGGMPLSGVVQRVTEFMGDPKAFAEQM
jgi:hypothetical protein